MRAISIVEAINWRLSRRTRAHGLWIGTFDGDHATQKQKLLEALEFIKLHDPLRYKIIRQDVKRLWVIILPGPLASFHVKNWCCRLDSRFIIAAAIDRIASVIVHEATHARLFRRGIGYREDLRHRVEAICLRQQIAFAAKIPTSEKIESEVQHQLKLDSSNWSDGALARRRRRGLIESLRYLGMPDWLIAFSWHFRHKRRQPR